MSDSADRLLSEYTHALQNASWRFQFLEEGLKMYMSRCCVLISSSLDDRIPFRYSYKDFADKPLGQLIRVFKKLNSNGRLISQLEALVKDRNHCAHRGYLLTSEEIHDVRYLSRELAKTKAVARKADRAVKALLQELKAIDVPKGE